jgi:hypothetical protein
MYRELWSVIKHDENWLFDKVNSWRERLLDVAGQHAESTRLIDKVVRSRGFLMFFMFVVLADVCFSIHDMNENMILRSMDDVEIQYEGVRVNDFFTMLYVLELCLRIASDRVYFFVGPQLSWNWFDLIVVTLAVSGRSQGWMRVVRLMKIARAARFLKVLKLLGLHKLNSMIKQIGSCLPSLFWCFVCWCMVTFLFAMFFMYSIMETPGFLDSDSTETLEMFGSVQQSCVTLFMATTGGFDWQDVYHGLHETGTGTLASIVFLWYIAFFFIAVTNIITASFMENMLKLTKEEADEFVMEKWLDDLNNDTNHSSDVIQSLFSELDEDDSGRLSDSELKEWQRKMPQIQRCLRDKGVSGKEAFAFFAALFETGHTKHLDKDVLAACCRRIKGVPTSIDLQTMRYELTCMMHEQRTAIDSVLRVVAGRATQHLPENAGESLVQSTAGGARTPI